VRAVLNCVLDRASLKFHVAGRAHAVFMAVARACHSLVLASTPKTTLHWPSEQFNICSSALDHTWTPLAMQGQQGLAHIWLHSSIHHACTDDRPVYACCMHDVMRVRTGTFDFCEGTL
jgi:hypothetical protein